MKTQTSIIGRFTISHSGKMCVVTHADGARGFNCNPLITQAARQRKALGECVRRLIKLYGPVDFLSRLHFYAFPVGGGRVNNKDN